MIHFCSHGLFCSLSVNNITEDGLTDYLCTEQNQMTNLLDFGVGERSDSGGYEFGISLLSAVLQDANRLLWQAVYWYIMCIY